MRNKYIERICKRFEEEADTVMLLAFSMQKEEEKNQFVEIAMDIDMVITKLKKKMLVKVPT